MKVKQNSKLNNEVHMKIERAVLKIFSKTDFHKANMRQVAKEAGVSFETIYKHFKSKEGLLFHFIPIWLEESIADIKEHLQGIESIRERMRKFTWIQEKFFEMHPEIGIIIFMTVPLKTWMDDSSFGRRKEVRMIMALFKEGQETKIINPKINRLLLMDFWLGIMTRAFTMWIYRKQPRSLTHDFNTRFEMYWRAISRDS